MDNVFRFNRAEQLLIQFLLLTWAIIVIFPFMVAVFNSLKLNPGAIYRDPIGLPNPATLNNFVTAWVEAQFGTFFKNSLFFAGSVTFLSVMFGSAGAYALARMPFKGSKVVFICFMVGVIIPIRLTLPALYEVVRQLNLTNSLIGLIMVQTASMMPVAVFLLTSFLKSISLELEEAARMDGATPIQIYWHIILPLLRPAMATVGLLAFVGAWNEYFFPLIFIDLGSPEKFVLTQGITTFQSEFAVQWNLMFAGILIMLIPTLIVFLAASKQFIHGLSAGGVKE